MDSQCESGSASVSQMFPTGAAPRARRGFHADPILALVNRGGAAEGGLTLTEFAERYFLPWVKAKKKPSTFKFYDDLFENHIRDRVGFVRLRDFTTRNAQEVLDASSALSHSSVLRIKTGLSAIFSHAIRLGFILGANPAREAKAEGKRSDPQLHAYASRNHSHAETRR